MLSKLLKNTIKFSAIVALTVYSIDFIVTKGLRKSNSIHYDNFSKIFSGSMNADLLINGSSKGYVQFSPKILDSLLLTNSYNISLDGNNFLTQNTLIYLKGFHAKKVLEIIHTCKYFQSLRK